MATALGVARTGATHVSAACAALSGLCFLAIFLVNVTQIGLRSLAGGGWIWVTDLSQLLFIWMVMLGTVAAYHAHEHIVVDFLVARLTGLRETVAAGLTRVVEIGLFAILLQTGLDVARVRGGISYIQLGVPTSWGFYAIPVAAALLLLLAFLLPLRFERPVMQDEIGHSP
ncbi:MAG: TRAP transporter small permease [Euzebyales bacterium]|jgi:TRAP-type C4-dicarboxylate transport system permease small subunit|nr:TRAP transporter small permease [Euzebyales bacterium]